MSLSWLCRLVEAPPWRILTHCLIVSEFASTGGCGGRVLLENDVGLGDAAGDWSRSNGGTAFDAAVDVDPDGIGGLEAAAYRAEDSGSGLDAESRDLVEAANADTGAWRSCGAMNAAAVGPGGFSSSACHNVLGWAWDGAKCTAIVGCSCQGSDCGNLLPVQSACRAAYAHCG